MNIVRSEPYVNVVNDSMGVDGMGYAIACPHYTYISLKVVAPVIVLTKLSGMGVQVQMDWSKYVDFSRHLVVITNEQPPEVWPFSEDTMLPMCVAAEGLLTASVAQWRDLIKDTFTDVMLADFVSIIRDELYEQYPEVFQ